MIETGLKRLITALPESLRGARVGLVAHPASVAVVAGKVQHACSLLAQLPGLELVRLFGPEHGLYGTAHEGAAVTDSVDTRTGLPVVSLYGERRAPSPAHLSDLDALLFDLQDVGVRCFTYLSTLKACLKVCADANVTLVVLDRPNPLGRGASGPGVELGFESFVAAHNVRFLHGMTIGELALLMARDLALEQVLEVIPMRGWRGEPWEQTGLPWLAPSPALERLEAAKLYPLTVFLEGCNLSEGRGSYRPFEQFGAPWLRPKALIASLQADSLGLEAQPVRFIPTRARYQGQDLPGVRLRLKSVQRFDPPTAALALLKALYAHGAEAFEWLTPDGSFFIDRLYGSAKLRLAVSGELDPFDWELHRRSGELLEKARVTLYDSPEITATKGARAGREVD